MNINLNKLRAVRKMTAKNDIRYYLNGVCIGRGMLVATNGHYLIKADDEGAQMPDDIKDGQIIVSNEVLDAVFRKVKDRKYKALGEVELNVNGAKCQFRIGGELLEEFTPIDGTFPNWERVLPSEDLEEKVSQFNWDYLALFNKAYAELGAKGAVICLPHGDNAASIEFPGHDDVSGVLMPILIRSTVR